jgi:hypothetical protein
MLSYLLLITLQYAMVAILRAAADNVSDPTAGAMHYLAPIPANQNPLTRSTNQNAAMAPMPVWSKYSCGFPMVIFQQPT